MLNRLGVLRACNDDVGGTEEQKERGQQAVVLCFCGRYGHLESADGALWTVMEGEGGLVGAVEGMLDAHRASQKDRRSYSGHRNTLQHSIDPIAQAHKAFRYLAVCICDESLS
jgi:hypothetical protein